MVQVKLSEGGEKWNELFNRLDELSKEAADLFSEDKGLTEGNYSEYDDERFNVFSAFDSARAFIKAQIVADLSEQLEYKNEVTIS